MSEKNRNGKPTAFQMNALAQLVKELGEGDMKAPRTYRDAENLIRRLRTALKNKQAETKKYGCAPSCKYKNALKAKDAADRFGNASKDKTCSGKNNSLPTIKNGTDTQTVSIPLSAKEKAAVIAALTDFTDMLGKFEETMDTMMASAMRMFPF